MFSHYSTVGNIQKLKKKIMTKVPSKMSVRYQVLKARKDNASVRISTFLIVQTPQN